MSVPRFLFLLAVLAATAQAAGPTLDHLFPAGGQRGQTVEVRLSGRFDRWPVRVWVDEPGVTFEPAPETGKLIARVDPAAAPGPRLLRVVDDQGASAPRPFLVGILPERLEAEPNDELGQAQRLAALPVVVNGRLGKRGDVDVFSVELQRGQTLVVAVEANRRLGSPMDAVIQVVSAEGAVLRQVDDTAGLDPAAAFEAAADGRYLVRIFAFPEKPDSSIAFAGGESFVYRLTLTTSGLLENVLPLARGQADQPEFEAIGWNLPSGLGSLRTNERDGRLRVWHPLLAGDIEVPLVPHVSHKEGKAGPLIPPFALSGRITGSEKEDRHPIVLMKSKTYRFRVEAEALGSPLDPVLRIHDAAGKLVAERDDSRGRDVELTMTAPGDGVFEAVVSDLNGQASGRHVYLLSAAEPVPDFALEAVEDRLTLTPGKSATLALKVVRRDGFDRPIVLECDGLPAGVSMRPESSRPKEPTAASVTLTFEAAPDARAFSGPFRVRGRSGDVVRLAAWLMPGHDRASVDRIWLTVPSVSK